MSQPAQILEIGRERVKVTLLQKLSQPELDLRTDTQRHVPITTGQQLRGHAVGVGVLADQFVDVGGADAVDDAHQVIDAVGVHRDTEMRFGFHLVTLGDGDAAHVVPEPGDLQRGQLGVPEGRTHPAADAAARPWITDMPGDGLAGVRHAGLDVTELAVAVCGLVEVHEVHVDGRPGQFDPVLGVQM